jgi:hypothetical protein
MPLDTGDMAVETKSLKGADELATLRPVLAILDETGSLGAALAAARCGLGLDVADIASATRIKTSYIEAIEAFDFSALPSRPFVIGFIRAYARALGLEPEAVVARFRAEAPPIDDDLKAPVTIYPHTAWAPRIAAAAAVLIVLAVLGWNLWRHAQTHALTPIPATQVSSTASGRVQSVTLGAPLPMPPEASAPPTYQTPGLASDGAGSENANAGAVAMSGPIPAGAPFKPDGAVYGASAPGAGLILQARASTALVVRGGGGAVIFARELAKGEAWRAPSIAGLTVDVDSPSSMQVFVNGAAQGVLTDARTPLAHLIK